MWEVFYILPQTTTLIHESNRIKASALPTASTPLCVQTERGSDKMLLHFLLPLDHHAFPAGRLHLHSDFALQEGFPSLFLRPGPVGGKEPGLGDTSQRPCRNAMAYDDAVKKEGMTP